MFSVCQGPHDSSLESGPSRPYPRTPMNLENLARLFVPCPGGTEQQRREQRARLLRAALAPVTDDPREWPDDWIVLANRPPNDAAESQAWGTGNVAGAMIPAGEPLWSGGPPPVVVFPRSPTLSELNDLVGHAGAVVLPEVDEDLLMSSAGVQDELVLLMRGLDLAEGMRMGACGALAPEAWLAPDLFVEWALSTEEDPDGAVRRGRHLQRLLESALEGPARRNQWNDEQRTAALAFAAGRNRLATAPPVGIADSTALAELAVLFTELLRA